MQQLERRAADFPAGVGGAEVAVVDEPAEFTRGLGGIRPGRATLVQASDGTSHEVIPTSFLSDLGSRDLVVTRWFRHE